VVSGAEVAGEGGELVVGDLVAVQQYPSQPSGVHHSEPGPRQVALMAGGLEEADVERRVVGDQHGPAGEVVEHREHRVDRGCGRDCCGRDAGQGRDERGDGDAGIDERLELTGDHAPLSSHCADLGDGAIARRATGGLEVDHDEVDVAQWGTQVVETGLRAGGAGATGQRERWSGS
jgi:hypothetical protein